jgi:hypothetical protein
MHAPQTNSFAVELTRVLCEPVALPEIPDDDLTLALDCT